jgi:hypothetical protein
MCGHGVIQPFGQPNPGPGYFGSNGWGECFEPTRAARFLQYGHPERKSRNPVVARRSDEISQLRPRFPWQTEGTRGTAPTRILIGKNKTIGQPGMLKPKDSEIEPMGGAR